MAVNEALAGNALMSALAFYAGPVIKGFTA